MENGAQVWPGESGDSRGSAFWIYDPQRKRLEYADPGLEGVLGVSTHTIHRMIDELDAGTPESELASFMRLMDSQRVGAPPGCFDYRAQRSDGSSVWIRIRYVRVADRRRGRELIMGLSADVTDLKQAQQTSEAWSELEARVRERTAELAVANQALSEEVERRTRAERRFLELFESAPDAQLAVDSEGTIRLFNREAEQLYGWQASEVIGRSVWLLVPRRDRADRAAMLARFVVTPTPWRLGEGFDVCALRADGTEVPVEISLAPLASGRELFVVACIRDISARRREQEEKELLESHLRQWQKFESLGALAGGIAHDFNNLLAAVVNYANLALLRVGKRSPVREELTQIKQVAGRMSELASQMLTYAGRGASRMERVDLSAEIRQIRSLLAASVPRSAELVVQLPDDLPAARLDAAQLRQIVMNLVINSAEALAAAGQIRVRTGVLCAQERQRALAHLRFGELPEQGVFLEVADTGRGMEPEIVQRMFEPFYSTKQAGRGLGLATVIGIVRRHGGAIAVESGPGAGSRVLVALPSAQAGSDERAPLCSRSRRLEGARILLVDDEAPVRESARQLLAARGARPVACADGESALGVLREARFRFDTVLLDLSMPGVGGKAVLREIRMHNPRLPVVLCSGYRPGEEGAAAAADPYLLFASKPYDLIELTGRALGLSGPAPSLGEAAEQGIRA